MRDPRVAIRGRPGLFVGDVRNGHGVLGLIDALVRKAAVESTRIDIRLGADEAISIEDDGPGLAVEIPVGDIPLLETYMFSPDSSLHEVMLRDWADRHDLQRPDEIQREPPDPALGLASSSWMVLHHTSSWVELEVHRGGARYTQRFEDGGMTRPLLLAGRSSRTGTRVTFFPDPVVFTRKRCTLHEHVHRLVAHTVTNPSLSITLLDEKTGESRQLHHPEGAASYLDEITEQRPRIPGSAPVFHVAGEQGRVEVEMALVWCAPTQGRLESFANGMRSNGGPHVTQCRSTMFDTMRQAASVLGIRFLRRTRMTREQVVARTGAMGVISLVTDDGSWTGDLHDRFESAFAAEAVGAVLAAPLLAYFLANSDILRAVAARLP